MGVNLLSKAIRATNCKSSPKSLDIVSNDNGNGNGINIFGKQQSCSRVTCIGSRTLSCSDYTDINFVVIPVELVGPFLEITVQPNHKVLLTYTVYNVGVTSGRITMVNGASTIDLNLNRNRPKLTVELTSGITSFSIVGTAENLRIVIHSISNEILSTEQFTIDEDHYTVLFSQTIMEIDNYLDANGFSSVSHGSENRDCLSKCQPVSNQCMDEGGTIDCQPKTHKLRLGSKDSTTMGTFKLNAAKMYEKIKLTLSMTDARSEKTIPCQINYRFSGNAPVPIANDATELTIELYNPYVGQVSFEVEKNCYINIMGVRVANLFNVPASPEYECPRRKFSQYYGTICTSHVYYKGSELSVVFVPRDSQFIPSVVKIHPLFSEYFSSQYSMDSVLVIKYPFNLVTVSKSDHIARYTILVICRSSPQQIGDVKVDESNISTTPVDVYHVGVINTSPGSTISLYCKKLDCINIIIQRVS